MDTPPENVLFPSSQESIDAGFVNPKVVRLFPFSGCLGILLVVFTLCVMPLFLVDAMRTAMERLHLSPMFAVLAVGGILFGSLINIPVYRISRENVQIVMQPTMFGFPQYPSNPRPAVWETIIAVNFGGCVIPVLLSLWQLPFLMRSGVSPLVAMAVASSVNAIVCYLASRPVSGIGIMMPGLVSPLTAVCMTWLLLGSNSFEPTRVSVAFVAGVVGPLVGADLMHLKDIKTRTSLSMLSIGGAGTFDGIILSGVVAALFA